MLDFLSTFANALFTLFNLLINIVKGLLQFFSMIPQFVAYLEAVFAYGPAPLVVFLMMGVLISVILLIVGRN